MAITKNQVLNMLANLKKRQGQGSAKYYTIGALRILVQNDLITPADIMAEFPEHS